MTITFLCKVVDNFGDIGVVYRLAKQISLFSKKNKINLITNDLSSFNKICSSVNVSLDYQIINNIHIYNWNAYDFCHSYFLKNDGEDLQTIIECFQCGRPDWLENILFDIKLERTVKIIMLDYLTAEDYAETFHLLDSLTRSKKVKKINFMPGFTDKTGGLIIDEQWKKEIKRDENGPILFFTYEKDFCPYLKAMQDYYKKQNVVKKILVAQGAGKSSFIKSFCETEKKYGVPNLEKEELSFINQEEWDIMMKKCSFLVVRGEESMARACLSGIPFLWHAYPQSDEYQIVKVRALLEKMKTFFSNKHFEILEKIFIIFNTKEDIYSDKEKEDAFIAFLENMEDMACSFYDFSCALRKNGDLATNLMTYIEKSAIIE